MKITKENKHKRVRCVNKSGLVKMMPLGVTQDRWFKNNGWVVEDLKESTKAEELAKENGLDIKDIKGTGKGGRVLKEDVEAIINEKKSKTDEN